MKQEVYYNAKYSNGIVRQFVDLRDDPRRADFEVHGGFEPTTMLVSDVISTHVSHIVDIGAHTGAFSIGLADQGKKARVLSFEPNPIAFSRLVSHIRLNKLENKITPFHMGVGEKVNYVQFNWTSDKGYGWIKSGTSLPQEEKSGFYIGAEITGSLIVPLDFILRHISGKFLIKIDVEGYELNVLKGCRDTLKAYPDFILETFSRDVADAISKILPAGYRFFRIHEKQRCLRESKDLCFSDLSNDFQNSLMTKHIDNYKEEFFRHGITVYSL
jgi:FkbM family methyltransferase